MDTPDLDSTLQVLRQQLVDCQLIMDLLITHRVTDDRLRPVLVQSLRRLCAIVDASLPVIDLPPEDRR